MHRSVPGSQYVPSMHAYAASLQRSPSPSSMLGSVAEASQVSPPLQYNPAAHDDAEKLVVVIDPHGACSA